ncbi:unnamed protein product [Moneuplotes crassus]|uniref:Uncharacterized protein n=1 Tax=Euplotes crassus TaxID=5936 RepID=A0AAD1UBM5_EUPCR|nr:unnamed protein product [Moneuplotes crassus]
MPKCVLESLSDRSYFQRFFVQIGDHYFHESKNFRKISLEFMSAKYYSIASKFALLNFEESMLPISYIKYETTSNAIGGIFLIS